MAWLLLFSAGFVEIIFALSLKYNEGFTKLWPSIITALSGIGSFGLLMWALKTLPLGTAYAVWTGMGAVGVAILGIILFKESIDLFSTHLNFDTIPYDDMKDFKYEVQLLLY